MYDKTKIGIALVAWLASTAALVATTIAISSIARGAEKHHSYLGIVVANAPSGDIKAAIPITQEDTEDACYADIASSLAQHADKVSIWLQKDLRVGGYCVDLSLVKNPLLLKPDNSKDEADKSGVDPQQLAKPRTST